MDFDYYVADFKQRIIQEIVNFRGRAGENDIVVNMNMNIISETAGSNYTVTVATNGEIVNSNAEVVDITPKVFARPIRLNGTTQDGTLYLVVNQPVDVVLTDEFGSLGINTVEFISSDENSLWVTPDGTLMPRIAGDATLTVKRQNASFNFSIKVIEV